MQQTNNNGVQASLITLHDALTDSPVYRSSSYHFDDQLDLLEKWLDSLSKHLKQYADKLNKFNLETNTLCKKVIPVDIDCIMIDSNFAGSVIKSFSDALQTSLAFKTKLVTDIEDNFIQPLQSFVKIQLREFKDFKKQHEKYLERYENQLYKYTSQSKTKEASALREEAFRLFEARKSMVHISGQHVVRVMQFRSLLEHFLVEKFTLATLYHLQDYEGGSVAWSKLESNLTSWKQWLVDDKDTCNYQLQQLQYSRYILEHKCLNNVRPARDLEKYTPGQTNRLSLDFIGNSQKWGYLFSRGSRSSWTRRWFFLYDGCFGSCHTSTSRAKGKIVIRDRVSVLLCEVKPLLEIDRRFCFEVICAHQSSFVLQAETEQEMFEWISVFEKSKRLMLENEQLDSKIEPPSDTSNAPSIVLLSSSCDLESLSTSLTPLLVHEAAHALNNSSLNLAFESDQSTIQSYSSNAAHESTWGIPWILMPSMFQSNALDDTMSETQSIEFESIVGWPVRADEMPKIDLMGYTNDLEACNKELRQLFGGVESEEVVLTAFVGSLKKKPSKREEQAVESPVFPSPAIDQLEQKLDSQISLPKEPSSEFGYSYTGKGYVTQHTFWFYSCIVLNCVNTVAVRLSDIKQVQLIDDRSIVDDENYVLAIELIDTQRGPKGPLIFTCLMDNVESLVEKFKFAIENAKSPNPSPLQTTFNTIHSFSKADNQIKAEPLDTPVPKRKSRKFSSPIKPKSGALAAAMMAATVAGGSGLLEARKEFSKEALLNTKKFEEMPDIKPSTEEKEESELPNDFKIPSGPVNCGCENHLDKLESQVELPLSAKDLYELLFDDENTDIWEKKTIGNKSRDLSMTQWEIGIEGKSERTLKYIIPVNNAMVKLKEAEAIERQILEKKEDYLCYVVMTTTKTPQLPYSDSFVPYLKYCITWVSRDRCKLTCHTGVKFLKSILVKGIVSKAAMKGMSENLGIFVPIIQGEVSKKNSQSGKVDSVQEVVSLKREDTIKKAPSESNNLWYTQHVEPIVQILQDLIHGLPSTIKISLGIVAFLWLMYSQLFRTKLHTKVDQEQIVSRAVYLKDIDQGLLHRNIQTSYDQSDSFRLFLELNSQNQTKRHHWQSINHRQLAIDLLFSRQRVALLRHDTLALFQLMNEVDAQLLENEYVNWLMDVRIQCALSDADNYALYCEDVKQQLTLFPMRSTRKNE